MFSLEWGHLQVPGLWVHCAIASAAA
eukprot:SAG11_NODE_28030_length_326_cov_0.687225_1_plen_25_part_10